MLKPRAFLVILGLLLVPTSADGQPAPLDLQLSLGTGELKLAEPVRVQVALRNTSSEPQRVFEALGPEYGEVIYEITDPRGKVTTFSPWVFKEVVGAYSELEPEETIVSTADLFFDGQDWTFTDPGTYVVQAKYRDRIASNRLKFVVESPSDSSATQASRLLLNSQQAGRFLLLGGGDHLSEGIEVLEKVRQIAPESPYAAHASYALGVNFMEDFTDFQNERVREAKPERALEYLKQVDPEEIGSIVPLVKSHLALASAYRLVGEEDSASSVQRRLSERLQDRYPELATMVEENLVPKLRSQYPDRRK